MKTRILLIIATIFFTACSNNNPDKFEGIWVPTQDCFCDANYFIITSDSIYGIYHENVYFPCRYSELTNGSIRLERSWMEDVSRPDYTEEVSMILDQNGILEIEKFLPTSAQIYPCEYYSLKLERK